MKFSRGFTLIEVMIVCAIIAILAGLAYPSYASYVQRSNRADAKTALMSTAQRLERCFSALGRYSDTTNCAVAASLDSGGTINSDEGFYTVSAVALTTAGFTLRATAATAPQTGDTGCTAMTLDNTGSRLPATCWDR